MCVCECLLFSQHQKNNFYRWLWEAVEATQWVCRRDLCCCASLWRCLSVSCVWPWPCRSLSWSTAGMQMLTCWRSWRSVFLGTTRFTGALKWSVLHSVFIASHFFRTLLLCCTIATNVFSFLAELLDYSIGFSIWCLTRKEKINPRCDKISK